MHAVIAHTLHADFGDVAAVVGAAWPALAARASKKSMALRTSGLGITDPGGEGGLGTADAVATVRLTSRAAAEWIERFQGGGGVVGQAEGNALMGSAGKEGVHLVAVKVRAGGGGG